ncbi:ATP-binding cassette domain-containing protein [Staphylospora marina]|uniref:ATP-binding cassette domain-containing protein n=1 Tax=Staphylospora marina TaxID=2490858 RepID=UPI0013DDE448|nr:ATP-binding cassette domain-containing protein [Staphylospora marina]
MEPLIRLSEVRFHHDPEAPDEHWAVRDVSLEIRAGEHVAIIGANGSGKSTLAKLMCGLIRPVHGEVRVAGMNSRDPDHLWEIRRRVGLVFQNPENQIVGATVEEDLAFGLENLGISREEMERRILRVLDQTGLAPYRHESPHRLSGGFKQRLAIAGIWVMNPDAIILDEASSMLDPAARRELSDLLRDRNREGAAIIRITHRAEEAFEAGRVLVMDRGRLVLDLPSDELWPQADILERWGLDVPVEILLHRQLIRKGWPLPDSVSSREELVNAICRCLSGI